MYPFGQTAYFPPEVIIFSDIRNGYCGDNYDVASQEIMTL